MLGKKSIYLALPLSLLLLASAPAVSADDDTSSNTGYSFRSVTLADGLSAGLGRWEYMYTAEPYAFYRNTATMEWKMVQVTPTWTHVQNTVVNGWMSSLANSYNYWGRP